MTLNELRKALADLDLPGDTPVILQKDAEGNGYSPLDGAEEGRYLADSTYSGKVYVTDAQVDAPEAPYTDEDRAPDEAVPAVVLWPVN